MSGPSQEPSKYYLTLFLLLLLCIRKGLCALKINYAPDPRKTLTVVVLLVVTEEMSCPIGEISSGN